MIEISTCQVCNKSCNLPTDLDSPKLGTLDCGCIFHFDCLDDLEDTEDSMYVDVVKCEKCKISCKRNTSPLKFNVKSKNESDSNNKSPVKFNFDDYQSDHGDNTDLKFEYQMNLTVKTVQELVNSTECLNTINCLKDEVNRLKYQYTEVCSKLTLSENKVNELSTMNKELKLKYNKLEKLSTVQANQVPKKQKPDAKSLTLQECLEICNAVGKYKKYLYYSKDWEKPPNLNKLLKMEEMKVLHAHLISDKTHLTSSMSKRLAYLLEAVFQDKRLGSIMRTELYKKLFPKPRAKQALNQLILSDFGCYLIQSLVDKSKNINDEVFELYFERIVQVVFENLNRYVYHKNSVYVVEKLILFLSEEQLDQFIEKIIKPDATHNLQRLCTHQNGTHVVQSLVKNCKKSRFKIAFALKDCIENVSRHLYGMHVTNHLAYHLSAKELKQALKGYDRWLSNEVIVNEIMIKAGGPFLIEKLSS